MFRARKAAERRRRTSRMRDQYRRLRVACDVPDDTPEEQVLVHALATLESVDDPAAEFAACLLRLVEEHLEDL
jgi:hypothetical protein